MCLSFKLRESTNPEFPVSGELLEHRQSAPERTRQRASASASSVETSSRIGSSRRDTGGWDVGWVGDVSLAPVLNLTRSLFALTPSDSCLHSMPLLRVIDDVI